MRAITFLILLLTLFSCANRDTGQPPGLPDGVYKGHFIRSSPLTRYAPANVRVVLSGNTFKGESETTHYPAIGHGTFGMRGAEVEFTNEAIWTADFDWSLILSGKFQWSVEGDTLEMTQSQDGHTDHYMLVLE